ncbi:MAG: hypothetical protein ACJAZQ_003083 [Cognaticolwellia sp.]|jgi:hypothetical protein
MSLYVNKILLMVSLIILCSVTHASLITNGSFEQLDSSSYGKVYNTNLNDYEHKDRVWDVFIALPGWRTTYGNGIELQKDVVTNSQDGSHHVELDSHMSGGSNSVMTQSLDSLTIGAEYLLEFYYKPRTNNTDDNGIHVYWYDTAIDFDFNMQAVLTADSTKSLTIDWTLESVSLIAQSTSMDLSFSAFGRQNTLGGLVDNISLEQTTSVPEPSTIAMFFAAGFGMLFIRRRHRINS